MGGPTVPGSAPTCGVSAFVTLTAGVPTPTPSAMLPTRRCISSFWTGSDSHRPTTSARSADTTGPATASPSAPRTADRVDALTATARTTPTASPAKIPALMMKAATAGTCPSNFDTFRLGNTE